MALTLDGTAGISTTGNIISSAGVISATGNIYGGNIIGSFSPATLNIAGNITGGNLLTGGLISSTGNVTGGNISAVANISGGNISISGASTASSYSTNGNITGGNLLTGGLVSITGNITSADFGQHANLIITGTRSATINVTGIAIRTVSSTYTDTATLGVSTATDNHINVLATPTLAAANSGVTTTRSSTLYISGAPVAGTNMTITNAYALYAAAGNATIVANITGGNLLTGGQVSATSNITGGNLSVGSGTATLNTIINGGLSATGNIGSATVPFNTIFAKATSAQYADLAEMYMAASKLEEGTVVEFGGPAEIQQSSESHSTKVAGIISTNPSYLMNSGCTGTFAHPVALTGRVPCWVVGKIVRGDRLVASNRAGIATALDMEKYQPGCIIAKALGDWDSDEIGLIEVAVGRT